MFAVGGWAFLASSYKIISGIYFYLAIKIKNSFYRSLNVKVRNSSFDIKNRIIEKGQIKPEST